MKGFQKGRKLDKIGLKAQVLEFGPSSHYFDVLALTVLLLLVTFLSKDTAELFFEDVRLPASALLGELNKGFYYLMNELPQVIDTQVMLPKFFIWLNHLFYSLGASIDC